MKAHKISDYIFLNVLDVAFRGELFNFVLEKVNNKYEFREISLNEGKHYKKELQIF